jgi:hypothetical protein
LLNSFVTSFRFRRRLFSAEAVAALRKMFDRSAAADASAATLLRYGEG